MYQGRSVPRSRASRCHQDSACPVNRATSTARAARCRPPVRNAGSSRPAHRARSVPSSDSDQRRSCSRRSGSNGGSRNSPSASARTYNPVPPRTIGSRLAARVSAIQPAASRANRPALYRSPGATRSSPRCGTRACVARSGLAVPMSSPRYTWRASAEITVTGVWAASATATPVFPTPVGPTTTGVRSRESGPTKPAFQFLFGELHHGRPPMDIVRRKRRRQEPHNQLAHFAYIERLPGLDGGAAGIGRRKALQPILPPAEPPARQIGDELLQAAGGLETRMRVRRGVHDDAAAGKRLDLVADAREQLPMGLD